MINCYIKIVNYCGAECQKQHWKVHKKICQSSEPDLLCKTVINALESAASIGALIVADMKDISLIFAGARNIFENSIDFIDLFNLLQKKLYPELKSLKVTLIDRII